MKAVRMISGIDDKLPYEWKRDCWNITV